MCDTTNENYMLHHCHKCPNQNQVFMKSLFPEIFKKKIIYINFKQWVNTDISQLDHCDKSVEDFAKTVCDLLHDLTENHFSKKQNEYFKKIF